MSGFVSNFLFPFPGPVVTLANLSLSRLVFCPYVTIGRTRLGVRCLLKGASSCGATGRAHGERPTGRLQKEIRCCQEIPLSFSLSEIGLTNSERSSKNCSTG